MLFDNFFITGEISESRIIVDYDIWLVILSFLIANFATYVAIELSLQLRREISKRMQILWHVGGSIAMGAGIWAMHFTGMLSYHLKAEHSYSIPITLLSLISPILVSALVLGIIRRNLNLQNILIASPFMAAGIVIMHYSGMAAMQIRASVQYIPEWFYISVLIALTASAAALCIISWIANNPGRSGYKEKFVAAFVMAIAICGMHYSGMQATVIIPFADCRFSEEFGNKNILIAAAIGGIVVLTLALALAAIIINQKFVKNLQEEVVARTKELQEKQSLLDTVIKNLPLALFAKDAKDDYRWVICNKKAEEIFGISADQAIGKTDHDNFEKNEAEKIRLADEQAMKNMNVVNIEREEIFKKDGSWFSHTIKVPLYDYSGNPMLLIGIMEDITKQIEREKELENARNVAIAANALKSEFLANISHELRTPMHSIITFSRHGIERINKWELSEHKENLELINSSGQRLLLILNDLLDLSKLEAGVVKYEIKEYDLSQLINTSMRSLNSLAMDKSIKLSYIEPVISTIIECDPEKILQVLINIISNAIKFSPSGKNVTIQIVLATEMAESVKIIVSDEGIGIPENELEQIFDKFIQSSKTKTGAGGTGLGLAICKEITNGHGGKIWAQNSPTGGAELCIVLPIKNKGEKNE